MSPLLLLLASVANAQDLNAQAFRHSVDATRTLWTDDSGHINSFFSGGARISNHYAHQPFVAHMDDGTSSEIVGGVLTSDIMGHASYENVRVGLAVPVHWFSTSEVSSPGYGLGDIQLDVRGAALDQDKGAPIGLAAVGRLLLPTNTVGTALGQSKVGYEIGIIGDVEVGPVLLAANGGLRGVPRAEVLDVVWGDQGYYRFGAGAEVASDTYVSLDLTGAVTIATLTDPKIAGVPIEVLLGGHRKLVNDITVRGGIGTGLTNGISAPAFRAVLALDYAPGQPAAPKDTDGDGFIDSEDSCPDQPEDVDSYNDTDGCPDPSAAVTLKAVDAEGNPVAGATLSLWSGGTQVSLADLAVHEPTSFVAKAAGDGFESGEVEVEVVPSDGDKVVTITLTAIPEPPIVEPEVVVKAERIDLKDQVHFASGTAQLRTASHKVLDRVAELMALHTNILVLRIEGHTDATGSDESNQTLSQARAQTVMAYLIKKGVSGDRLVAKGHGESKLLDQDETEVAHEKNRRVEMYVETWAEE